MSNINLNDPETARAFEEFKKQWVANHPNPSVIPQPSMQPGMAMGMNTSAFQPSFQPMNPSGFQPSFQPMNPMQPMNPLNNPMMMNNMYQQQLYNEFIQYCKMTGGDPTNQMNFNLYCQMRMGNMNNNNMPVNPGMIGSNGNMNNMVGSNGAMNNMVGNNGAMNNMVGSNGTMNNMVGSNGTMNNMVGSNGTMNNVFGSQVRNVVPQPQVNNFNPNVVNQPSGATGDVYVTDPNKPKEVLPRVIKTMYVDKNEMQQNFQNFNNFNNFNQFGGMGNDIVNITMTATSGLKVVIPAPKTMPLSDLFITYVRKVGVPDDVIGTKIVFLFNAEKLDVKSKEPLSKFFKSANHNVTVLDQGNIIGA